MSEEITQLGKYQVLGIAGKGGMGTVYVAFDPFIDRKVAIKLCPVGTLSPNEARRTRKMFYNEARAAGQLEHPGILRVYDAGEEDGNPYIVMEYVEGACTLKDLSDPQDLLHVPDAVRIFIDCAKALDYAHRRGVTHRDVKSANIMLNREGEVKICDFGIAQRAMADETQVLGSFGSPSYMSPEQARDEELTSQTDLYSLGVVFYEVLTGQQPFTAASFASLLHRIVYDEPTPVRELRPEIPQALADIVARAMHKNRQLRYMSGADVANDLAALLESADGSGAGLREPSSEERIDAMRAMVFFKGFSDGELQEVNDVATWVRCAAGGSLVTAGDAEQAFYIIVYGQADVMIGGKRIAEVGAGDCVGEMGYLGDGARSASVVARGVLQALKVDAPLVEWASIPCQMNFGRAFTRLLVQRLARTSSRLAEQL